MLCNFLKSWICCVRRMLLLANKNRQQITHSTESESRWINLNSYFCYKNYSRPFWNKAKKATQSHKIISIAMYVIMYMCHLTRFTYSNWHFWQKGLLLAGLEFNLLILKSNYKKISPQKPHRILFSYKYHIGMAHILLSSSEVTRSWLKFAKIIGCIRPAPL